MSGERDSLWGVQRRKPVAHDERVDDGAGANPKEAHVLDLQQKAGNAAVTGVVQRSLWGDDSWLGGVGSVFPATGGGGMGGFPDVSKAVEPDQGAGAGAFGGKVDDGGGYKDPYGGAGGKMDEPAGGKFDDPFGGGGGKMDDPYGDEAGYKDPSGGGGGGGVIVGDDAYKDTGGKW